MNSIIQAKSKLPIDFINYIDANFGERVVNNILSGMCETRNTTFRVNTLKSSNEEVENFLTANNIEFEKCDFYDSAYIVKKTEKEMLDYDICKEGKIYLQSLSSMVPPLVLDAKPGEAVLDMTSAPGSKTTEIAALTNNKATIYANEIDKIRFERLKFNIEKQGANIAEVINDDGCNLGDRYPETFDKVLLDTPCSGEGRFLLNESSTYSKWSTKMVNELSALQVKLITGACKALKSGGTLVYSTCTLNKEENEKIVDYAIKNLNMEVAPIDLKIKNKLSGDSKGFDKQVKDTIKIIPNKNFEGFYVAKLIKK